MAKKVKQCSNCAFWKESSKDRNLCSAVLVGTDVFINGSYLMTGADFGCNKHKDKEVDNDSNDNTIPVDGIGN